MWNIRITLLTIILKKYIVANNTEYSIRQMYFRDYYTKNLR